MPHPRNALWLTVGVAVILSAVAGGLQFAGQRYGSEFGEYPDEGAHLVTAMMVRDYVAGGLPDSPMRFAEVYYLHYPKVAFGHWPPVFHLLLAGWMLIFPTSWTSLLVLMALLAGSAATILFHIARREFGKLASFTIAVLFLALPSVQQGTGRLMAEVPLTLGALVAIGYLVKWLTDGERRSGIGFAIATLITILVKGDGWALVPMAVLAVALTGGWRKLPSAQVWTVAGIVALAVPWQILTWKLARNGWYQGGLVYAIDAARSILLATLHNTGMAVAILALAGLVVSLAIPVLRRQWISPFWAVQAAVLLGVVALQLVTPVGMEGRRLILALPSLLLLAASGLRWLAEYLHSRWGLGEIWPVGAGVLLFFFTGFAIPKAQFRGCSAASRTVLGLPQPPAVVLVSGSATIEGAFVAEVAMQARQSGRFILRASKLLLDSDWSGVDSTLRVQSYQDVAKLLDRLGVGAIVLERDFRRADSDLVHEAVEHADGIWRLVPLPMSGSVDLYLRNGPQVGNRAPIEIDLRRMLGRVVRE